MPERAAGFVTGGTWCVDRNKLVEFWPAEDGMAQILAFEQRGGGSGCNFAVDIRKLDPGIPVATIGLVGDDEDGRFLLAEADAYGIERRALAVTAAAPTQCTDAYGSLKTGRRTHLYFQGTAALLTPDHFVGLENFAGRFFHLGLPGVHPLMDSPCGEDSNGWVSVLRKARAAGFRTSLELASAGADRIAVLGRPCLPYLDYLIVNDLEIGALAGVITARAGRTDTDAVERAIRTVAALAPLELVAAHFPTGAVAATKEGTLIRLPSIAVPSEEIVAANGAGDAFAAGTLYGVHQGWDIAMALRLGHAAAAASLRGLSTTGTVGTWHECLAVTGRWGTRESR
ncbi:MAG: carbohydrate kinase family protein [Acetobacteraceae bacterium]